MSAASRFLSALAQAFAAMALYAEGHPARERSVEAAHEKLLGLREEDPSPRITFLQGDIIYNDRPLTEMKKWDWAGRLEAAGVQRLEILGPVSFEEFEGFLDDTVRLLLQGARPSAEVRQTRLANIRFGTVGLDHEKGDKEEADRPASPELSFALQEEADAVQWLHEQLQEKGDLHLVEAEAIIRSLSVAMHGDQQILVPLVRMKRFDQYTTTHALNVAVLSMALAEFFGLSPHEVKAFGVAGLMHDLGKVKIPREILNKAGKLTPEERRIMNTHPAEGARIILDTEHHLDLAAVVAYEHHIRIDGGGYPSLSFPRICHQASNMVHVCDVYDALRTHRPYRGAWPQEKVLSYIRDGAGREFDYDLATGFIDMLRRWESRIAELPRADRAVPLGRAAQVPGAMDGPRSHV